VGLSVYLVQPFFEVENSSFNKLGGYTGRVLSTPFEKKTYFSKWIFISSPTNFGCKHGEHQQKEHWTPPGALADLFATNMAPLILPIRC